MANLQRTRAGGISRFALAYALISVLCSRSVEAQYSYDSYVPADPTALSVNLHPYPGPENWIRINLTTYENIRAFTLHFNGPAVITGVSFGDDLIYNTGAAYNFNLEHNHKTVWGLSSDSSAQSTIPFSTYESFLRVNFTYCPSCTICLEPSSTFFGIDSQILAANTQKDLNLCTKLGDGEYNDFTIPQFQGPAVKGSVDVRIFYRTWLMDDGIGVSVRVRNQKAIGAFQLRQTTGPAPVDCRPGATLEAHEFSLFSANGNIVGVSFKGNSLPEVSETDTELIVLKFSNESFAQEVCLKEYAFSDSSGTKDLSQEFLQGSCLWLVQKTPFSYYDLPEIKYKDCNQQKDEISFEASNIYPHFLVSLQGKRVDDNPNEVLILSKAADDGIVEDVNAAGVLCEEVESGLTEIKNSKKRWVPDDGKLNNQKFNQENNNCNSYWYQVIDMETCAPSRLLKKGKDQVNPPMPSTPLTPLNIENVDCHTESNRFIAQISGASQLKDILVFSSAGGNSSVVISQPLVDEVNAWPGEFSAINIGICDGVTMDLVYSGETADLGVAIRRSKTTGHVEIKWPIAGGMLQLAWTGNIKYFGEGTQPEYLRNMDNSPSSRISCGLQTVQAVYQ